MLLMEWRETIKNIGVAVVARGLGVKYPTVYKWTKPGSKTMPTLHPELLDFIFRYHRHLYKAFCASITSEWQRPPRP